MLQTPSDTQDDWYNFLKGVSVFSELDESAIKELIKKLKPISLPRGAVLYREGDPGDAMYIVQSGHLRVVIWDDVGKEKVLNYIGRGEILGETSLLTGSGRSVTVRLDSDAHLLVLYKKDFEDFLKNNPSAAFYLSRLLSQRLYVASRPGRHRTPEGKFQGFFCELPKEDHIVFIINLCLSLTEQTRRKVLLLELSPYAAELIQSMKLVPILSSAKMLHAADLVDPKILEKLTLFHPSGLEIISISEETFSGILFRSIPAFMATLKHIYDYVVVDISGYRPYSITNSKYESEVARAFLRECHSVFYTCLKEPVHPQLLRILSQENEAVTKIVLGGDRSSLYFPVDFVVPWSDSIPDRLRKEGQPYLNGVESDLTERMLNRIARFIGKLQVGIALGSGAAYGYAAIGILRVLEREKIPIDFLAGTSMGALLGSFYASGKSAEELQAIAYTITKAWLKRNSFTDLNLPWPHGGFLRGVTISRFLRSVLGEREFKDLPTPFACVATDIGTGDPVVLREGKVWEAVRASLSLPIVFQPYKFGDRFLVDGGLVNPVPTSVIGQMGADILISVNLTSRPSARKAASRFLEIFPTQSPGMPTILFKMIYTMQYKIASARTDLSHVTIVPDTHNFIWADFHKAKEIIPLGEEAAEEVLTKIKSHLPFFADRCLVTLRRRY